MAEYSKTGIRLANQERKKPYTHAISIIYIKNLFPIDFFREMLYN